MKNTLLFLFLLGCVAKRPSVEQKTVERRLAQPSENVSCSLVKEKEHCSPEIFKGCVWRENQCQGEIVDTHGEIKNFLEKQAISLGELLSFKGWDDLISNQENLPALLKTFDVTLKDLKEIDSLNVLFDKKKEIKSFIDSKGIDFQSLIRHPYLIEKFEEVSTIQKDHSPSTDELLSLNKKSLYTMSRKTSEVKNAMKILTVSLKQLSNFDDLYNVLLVPQKVKDGMDQLGLTVDDIIAIKNVYVLENQQKVREAAQRFGVSVQDFVKLRLANTVLAIADNVAALMKEFGLSLREIAEIENSTFLEKSPTETKNILNRFGLNIGDLLKSSGWIFFNASPEAIESICLTLEIDARTFASSPNASVLVANADKFKKAVLQLGSTFDKTFYLNDSEALQLLSADPREFLKDKLNRDLVDAIMTNDLAKVKELIGKGADPNHKDPVGKLPLYWAMQGNKKEIIKILEEAGASMELRSQRTLERRKDGTIKETAQCPLKEFDPFDTESSYERCNLYERSDLVYTKEAGELIERQGDFWVDYDFDEVKLDLEDFSSLSSAFLSYQLMGFALINTTIKESGGIFPMRLGESKARMESQLNAMNQFILTLPKPSTSITVYRGMPRCSEEMLKNPARFLSTSYNPEFALKWAATPESCLLKIELPPGFPMFFLNIARGSEVLSEHEFLLPSHVLDPSGKISLATYKIEKETTKDAISYRKMESIEHQGETVDLVTATDIVARTFLIRPENAYTFEKNAHSSFEDYEREYVKKICHVDQIKGLSYLGEICTRANAYYGRSRR